MNWEKDKINRNIKDALKSFLIKYYLTFLCISCSNLVISQPVNCSSYRNADVRFINT